MRLLADHFKMNASPWGSQIGHSPVKNWDLGFPPHPPASVDCQPACRLPRAEGMTSQQTFLTEILLENGGKKSLSST